MQHKELNPQQSRTDTHKLESLNIQPQWVGITHPQTPTHTKSVFVGLSFTKTWPMLFLPWTTTFLRPGTNLLPALMNHLFIYVWLRDNLAAQKIFFRSQIHTFSTLGISLLLLLFEQCSVAVRGSRLSGPLLIVLLWVMLMMSFPLFSTRH